jgi:hypothetical protein
MTFNNMNLNNEQEDAGFENGEFISSEESGSRLPKILAGVFGGFILFAVFAFVLYALMLLPPQREYEATQIATENAQKTELALVVFTRTSTPELVEVKPSATPTATSVQTSPTPGDSNSETSSDTNSDKPTADPRTATVAALLTKVALKTEAATPTPNVTIDARTATVSALLTQAALSTKTVAPTPTELPKTGFAEDVGLPTMMSLSLGFIGIIFLARRLRTV